MSLSARNQLKGTIEEIQLGGVMAHGENLIESVITKRSADEMQAAAGQIAMLAQIERIELREVRELRFIAMADVC